jgi:hypothetical protein
MFSYLKFIIYDFFCLSCSPDSGTDLIPTSVRKMAHFSYYKPAVFFVKRDLDFKQTDKFKYKNIKLKKECEAEHA